MGKVLGKMGQSTLEYVIVLTAIVAAIIFAVSQFVRPSINNVYSSLGTRMNQSGSLFSNKMGAGVTTTSGSTASGSTASGSTASGSTASGGW